MLCNESTCTNGGSECNADSDATARLFAVSTAGPGGQAVELVHASEPGRMESGATALTNTFPEWSPFVFRRTAEQGRASSG